MPANTIIHSTTQIFLDNYDISSDLLIMKSGAVSLVLNVNAINFGLFAEEEQDAVIYAYAGLLNSLNYPIQIVVKSQTKDVTAYLGLLKEQEDQTPNQERRKQISNYREFVTRLIKERNVLDKKFYVVIPATSLEMGLLPPQSVLPGVKAIDISTVERSVIIDKARNILEPKRDHLINQFGRIGLNAKQLSTQELIQLFYMSYNPEAAEGQQITDTRSYTTALVSAQVMSDSPSLIQRFAQMPAEGTSTEAATPEGTELQQTASPDQLSQEYTDPLAVAPQSELEAAPAFDQAQFDQAALDQQHYELSQPAADLGQVDSTQYAQAPIVEPAPEYAAAPDLAPVQSLQIEPAIPDPTAALTQPISLPDPDALPPIAEIT
jgi:hypothetical protein